MANIAFNDGTPRTLANNVPTPGNRFRGFRPDVQAEQEAEPGLGNGILYAYTHRLDYCAELTIEQLRPADLDTAIRLKAHLLQGGVCTVNTEDAASRSYTCNLLAGSSPEIIGPDEDGFFSFRATLLNRGAAPFIAIYY